MISHQAAALGEGETPPVRIRKRAVTRTHAGD